MKNYMSRRTFIKNVAAAFTPAAAIFLPKFHIGTGKNISNKEASYYVKIRGSRLMG